MTTTLYTVSITYEKNQINYSEIESMISKNKIFKKEKSQLSENRKYKSPDCVFVFTNRELRIRTNQNANLERQQLIIKDIFEEFVSENLINLEANDFFYYNIRGIVIFDDGNKNLNQMLVSAISSIFQVNDKLVFKGLDTDVYGAKLFIKYPSYAASLMTQVFSKELVISCDFLPESIIKIDEISKQMSKDFIKIQTELVEYIDTNFLSTMVVDGERDE